MIKRKLGKTNEELTVVGFGGIVAAGEDQEDVKRYVSKAIEEEGINYFDVAPSYGNAEEMLGPAIEPYRDKIFLACKTGRRDAKGAEEELHQSLKRLHTDHFDLYQFHGVTSIDEVNQIVGAGGALETFLKAREKGLTRYIGFSAHTEESAIALIDKIDELSTVLFPFNWVCWNQRNFGPAVVKKAQEKNLGILALKALAKRRWKEKEERKWNKTWYSPVDTFEEASLALRFTLSQPITSATSPSHNEFLWWMCDIAKNLTPLSESELEEVKRRSEGLEAIFPH
ncbi:TPA: aldo/keto reductase [bacterium]|nr:aldo/keto reductase [bacterium]